MFFLAAKTPGRRLALDAFALIVHSAPALRLRVLELVARDKACEHLDKACHGESCILAKGFYDRLPAARSAALAQPMATGLLDKDALRTVALAHAVCPYYLSQDLVRWADVVVGDYNYYFDTSALLHALTLVNQWRVGLLIDEAHNLVDRARKMYTAELDQADLAAVRLSAAPALKKPLDSLHRAWRGLQKNSPQSTHSLYSSDQAYQVRPSLPDKFLLALQHATGAIAEDMQAHPALVDAPLQRFYFDALHFSRMAESFGGHALFDITLAPARSGRIVSTPSRLSRLCIRNVVPAPYLTPRFAAARSAALFSATLSPQNYYADMLGLPGDTVWVEVRSPFTAEQLSVQVVGNISTRYPDRALSLEPISVLMARQYAKRPGNYLVFLSSYDYLAQLALRFSQDFPHIAMWAQTQRMDEAARVEFLARFTAEGQGIGFAVLGGAFAEGIDLPGDRLIGAFIATLGLAQVNPVNTQIRQRMGEHFGAHLAYDYTYLYPGVQKVVQAAGRVIRTTSDQGVVYLMDDRFATAQVQRLLPRWWHVTQMRLSPADEAAGSQQGCRLPASLSP